MVTEAPARKDSPITSTVDTALDMVMSRGGAPENVKGERVPLGGVVVLYVVRLLVFAALVVA